MQIKIDSFEIMPNQIVDCTKNGQCSRCCECCSGVIPITKLELRDIDEYVKKHDIKPVNRTAPLAGDSIDITCPFASEHKCNIYEVRPKICRDFICSMGNEAAQIQKRRFYSNSKYRQIFLRDAIFDQGTERKLMTALLTGRCYEK
jgi:Fe-S-cluster containining protein